MHVNILEIDSSKPISLGFTQAYMGKFNCSLTSGTAMLVGNNLEPGKTISVETDFKRVSKIKLNDQPGVQEMKESSKKGDYFIRGIVIQQAYDAIQVDCGFKFNLEPMNFGNTKPQIGQSVEFVVHELSLWDQNL